VNILLLLVLCALGTALLLGLLALLVVVASARRNRADRVNEEGFDLVERVPASSDER
jgi:hypothetical protein